MSSLGWRLVAVLVLNDPVGAVWPDTRSQLVLMCWNRPIRERHPAGLQLMVYSWLQLTHGANWIFPHEGLSEHER